MVDLESIAAREEIRDVLVKYCRGIDRCDQELIRSVYHPDGLDDHGYWTGLGTDFAEMIVVRLRRLYRRTTHRITNTLIELNGEFAKSECYVMATLLRLESAADGRTVDTVAARYVDTLHKRSGVWAISSRKVIMDWTRTEMWNADEASAGFASIPDAQYFPEDLSYSYLPG